MNERDWELLRERFQAWTGMVLPETMKKSALKALREVAGAGNSASICSLAELDGNRSARQRLIDRLGLGTTWFNREGQSIAALAQRLASEHTSNRGVHVNLWSAGCSSGQEPYTLVMALLDAGCTPRVLATDVSRQALQLAVEGVYPERSLAKLPKRWRYAYTEPAGSGRIRVVAAVRRHVRFELHNFSRDLRLPHGYSRFDAVICRNALLYFESSEAVETLRRLALACRPGGYLLVGAIERPLLSVFGERDRELGELVQVGEDSRFRQPIRERPPLTATSIPSGLSAPRAPASRDVDIEPPGTDLAVELATADDLARGGAPDQALLRVEEILRRDPLCAPAHLVRGLLLKLEGSTEDAAESFRAASFLDKNAWLAPYQLGLCLDSLGKRDEAYGAYRHALDVLELNGPSGLVHSVADVEVLARTVAEVCRRRMRGGR